eukprot:307810-Karenia_brevis.AAC.1
MKSALAAYMPLAIKIFGSPHVCDWLKQSSLWSLILSRLLSNSHIVAPTARYTKLLNTVYMRVLRRMCNHCRYGTKTIKDIDVRRKLSAPSIDCLLMRGRLRYLARIVRLRPQALMSLLFSKPGNKRLAWSKLIVEDMRTLATRVSICSHLQHPSLNSKCWVDFMIHQPEKWSLAIATLHFFESRCDSTPSEEAPAS